MKTISKNIAVILMVLAVAWLSGCASRGGPKDGYVKFYEFTEEELVEEPYHSLPYKVLKIATGTDSLTDGVDGETGQSNGKYPDYESIDETQVKNLASGAFSGGLLFSAAGMMPGLGLTTFLLGHGDSDPATKAWVIAVSEEFDEQSLTQANLLKNARS